ncbi:phage repressor protein [bacterium]|nr:MAG: phage repressor protein [bacterium]
MKKRNTSPQAPVLRGRDAWIARLKAGETVAFREGGNSMTPRIKSRQKCTYSPVSSIDDIKLGDAVFCRVGGSYFTHLITAIRGEEVQISNNHGHVNGWTKIENVFGRVIKIEN